MTSAETLIGIFNGDGLIDAFSAKLSDNVVHTTAVLIFNKIYIFLVVFIFIYIVLSLFIGIFHHAYDSLSVSLLYYVYVVNYVRMHIASYIEHLIHFYRESGETDHEDFCGIGQKANQIMI